MSLLLSPGTQTSIQAITEKGRTCREALDLTFAPCLKLPHRSQSIRIIAFLNFTIHIFNFNCSRDFKKVTQRENRLYSNWFLGLRIVLVD